MTRPAHSQDLPPLRVEVERTGRALAWDRIRTTFKVDGGAATLSVVKHYVGGYGHRHRLVLLDQKEAAAVVDALRGCGLAELNDSRRRRGRDLYAVTWRGLGEGRVMADDPHGAADGRLSVCLTILERAVDKHVGAVPWRDIFFDKAQMGYLRVESTPAARVYLDGRDTGEDTPVAALPLRVGTHKIRFVSEELDRSYEVRILAGATTNLDVDLR